ncbi:MAG: alpha/beta hydrolase family protein [Armatimonadota bacterium]
MSERDVFRSDRDDGRFESTAGFVHATMKDNPPVLRYDPAMPADEMPAWRDAVRERLRDVMCFPDVPPQPEPRMVSSEPRDGYELQRWEAYPEPRSVVPYLVLVPDDILRPAPAVLCFPGSSRTNRGLAGEPEPESDDRHWERNRMALHYARRGMVAIAVENPCMGGRASEIGPSRSEVAINLIWMGRSYEGLSVFEKRPILRWAREQPWIDETRIATSGHSLGAKPALLLAVLEPEKIAAVVWNDFTCDFRERAIAMNLAQVSLWQYVPDFISWFDYPDLMAAIAPRPLLITEGGRTVHIERVREAFRALGAEERFDVAYYPKYADPADRPHDGEPIPEGLSMDEYLAEWANVDVPEHSFKPDVAVPWLAEVLESDG